MVTEELIREIRFYVGTFTEEAEELHFAVVEELAAPVYAREARLEEYLDEQREVPFSELLFSHIRRKGIEETEVYKQAGIDRRHFAKIRADRLGKSYHPGKNTVTALCLALGLTAEESEDLLQSAGYSLSMSSTADLVIRYCIEHGIHDLMEVNEILDRMGEAVL